MNGNSVLGLPDVPAAGNAAVNQNYVLNLVNGKDWKESVRFATAVALAAVTAAGTGVGKTLTADANGALSVDSVAAVNGNRALIKNQAVPADNGLYVVTDAGSAGTPFVLTRATDADQNTEVTANLTVGVAEGTVHGDQVWMLSTNDPIVVDTTALSFTQISSLAYTWGAGLLNTSGTISVELDTVAGAQTAGADGGSSGLEYDVTGIAGKLRAAVNATAGIQRTASGLGARLDGTSLVSSAAGLRAEWAKSTRNISFLSNEALTQFHPVSMSTTVNRVNQARANDEARAKIIGLNLTTPVGAGGVALEIIFPGGVAEGAIAGATPGDIFYLADTGGLTAANTLPSAGMRVQQIGIAKNATDLIVQFVDYGELAA